ncbi:diguanylate cyclase domain-containing protein [Roseovarius autotrophicus]|uniref:diguanylate cyclase domain-containing protein n=1 Tax=Roseovarius autotrophicus TaxID=2824121 RepID=UPI001B380CA1|nr:diguanylate cyclase [Roseovarius autotrophicus]
MRHVIIPLRGWCHTMAEALRGPQLIVFGLALALALLWYGARGLLLTLPLLLVGALPQGRRDTRDGRPSRDAAPGQFADMANALERRLARARRDGRDAACILLGIDRFAEIRARHGPAMQARLVTTCLDNLARALRAGDSLFDLGEGRFGVLLGASATYNPGSGGRVAQRLGQVAQSAAGAILPTDGIRVCATIIVARPGTHHRVPETIRESLDALLRHPPEATPVTMPLAPPQPPTARRTRHRTAR